MDDNAAHVKPVWSSLGSIERLICNSRSNELIPITLNRIQLRLFFLVKFRFRCLSLFGQGISSKQYYFSNFKSRLYWFTLKLKVHYADMIFFLIVQGIYNNTFSDYQKLPIRNFVLYLILFRESKSFRENKTWNFNTDLTFDTIEWIEIPSKWCISQINF